MSRAGLQPLARQAGHERGFACRPPRRSAFDVSAPGETTPSPGAPPAPRRLGPTIALALWTAFAGHLLVLIAAVTAWLSPNTAIVAALACSIIAVAALSEIAPPAARVRRAGEALIAAHGLAAAIMVAGIAPSLPWSIPRAGLAAAVAVGGAGLAVVGRAAPANPPPPLTRAPRVAAIALVVQALVLRWVTSATGVAMPLRAASLLSIAALGVAALASLSIVVLRVQLRWAIAALVAWTLGWLAATADLSSRILWSLGQPFPPGLHQLDQLDPELIQLVATAGGLGIGASLVASIRDARFRHSAIILLVGYAAFGAIAAVAEHRIELATDFAEITALRHHRDLADAIRSVALAGVLWQYWRRFAAFDLPRAATRLPPD